MQGKDMEFLKDRFNPYLIPLLKELIQKKPEDSYEFITKWIEEKGPAIQKELEEKQAQAEAQA